MTTLPFIRGGQSKRALRSVGAAIFSAVAWSGIFVLTPAIRAQSNYATPYTFGTLAGSSTVAGSVDATGTAARFNECQGIAVDAAGNIYVADQGNNEIRKITPAGVVTTLAGSPGSIGSADGLGSAARFNNPRGVAVDAAGMVYVADTENQVIRKITPEGAVTTIAGVAGAAGSADGPGSAARFNEPTGLVVDGSGFIYVADSNNSTIRRIGPDGLVTTFAGTVNRQGTTDGVGSAARFRFPGSVALDGAGNLYVANDYDGIVRKITPSRVVTTLAGTPADPRIGSIGFADGVGPAAGFGYTGSVAADTAGNVYVADSANATIRKITPAGVVTTLAGAIKQKGAADASGSEARFSFPAAIAVDAAGNLYIADPNPTPGVGGAPFTYPGSIRKGSLTAISMPATARLANLSARAKVGTDSNILIVGFVVGGSGNKSMLLRGAGSALLGFGISNYLAQPSLGLFNAQSVQINSNTGWNNNAALSATFARVGAFSYSSGSADSALEVSLPANLPFTAQVSGTNRGTGVSIAEIYDADANILTSPARLANISARADVGTGADVLIAGFVIGGSGADTVLIRGIGPTLATYGLNGLLANPVLTLFDGQGNIITSNQGWQNPPAAPEGVWTGRVLPLAAGHADFSKVGAFDLSNGTADSALIVTLPPGNYTAQISGVNSTGVAEVEVYEDN